ncbi:archaemetzincin family Zn-dependent metalloprotease [bacterium]|nr:archaemetzincin family Zn-dependent metalloprotease [bacterium]
MSLIRIIPLQFSGVEELDKILPMITRRFKMETTLSLQHLDLTPFFNPVRSQYDANKLILKLAPMVLEQEKVIGITDLDLYIPVLSYIFGQAYLGGSVALVSGHRLENSRYGLPHDSKLFSDRLLKCVLHELGHTFGLRHCLKPGCVMVSTTYVEELDQKSDNFCRNCQSELAIANA